MLLPEIIYAGIYSSEILPPEVTVTKERKTLVFEIELPLGNGGVSYIDGESEPIRENMILCAKPGQVRHTKLPYKCMYVHMNVYPGNLYNVLISLPNYFKTNITEKYSGLFKDIIEHYLSFSENEDILIQSRILELIYTLYCDVNMQVKRLPKGNTFITVEKAINHIEENFTEDMSLEAVARFCAVSPIHFHNIFKVATGKTLRTYIEERRIKEATKLLLTTDDTLTQIAFRCGFSSQSYFSYVFKRKMKCTPREYVRETYSKYNI